MTGESDIVVDPSNTARLAARLRAAGNDVTVLTYPWVGHLSIIGAFALPLRFLAPVLHDVDGFIAKTEAAPRRANHAEAVPLTAHSIHRCRRRRHGGAVRDHGRCVAGLAPHPKFRLDRHDSGLLD